MTYFQVIPLYLKSDEGASEAFKEFLTEANAISGSVPVLLANEVNEGDAGGIVTIFDKTGKERYPGLQRAMLPCFWVEDGFSGHTVILLQQRSDHVQRVLGALADCAKRAFSAEELGELVAEELRKDAVKRDPALNAIHRRLAMPTQAYYGVAGVFAILLVTAIFSAGVYYPGPATEKTIALVCGVVFVAVMLLIAVIIPSPTTSQDRTFRIVLALAAAGFISMTPGFINVEISTWLKAGGALAVFALAFFFNPGSLVANARH